MANGKYQGIKIKMKNGEEKAQHYYVMPSLKTIVTTVLLFVTFIGVVVGGVVRFIAVEDTTKNQVPANTQRIDSLERRNRLSRTMVRQNRLLMKVLAKELIKDTTSYEMLMQQLEATEAEYEIELQNNKKKETTK